MTPNEGFAVKFTADEMHDYHDFRRERDVIQQNGPVKSEFKDRQLAKALSYIHKELGIAGTDEDDDKSEKKKPVEAKRDEAESKDAAAIDIKLPELLKPRTT